MRGIAAVCLIFVALVLQMQPARAAEKVALVIGNSNYAAAGRLSNPANDMRIVADALRQNQFDVTTAADASLDQFRATLRDFRAKANGAEVAMVYFAGHGIEANGRNWLIPVDAKLQSDFDLSDEAVDLDRILEALAGSKVRIVVLDACRNNPFGRSWSSRTRSVARGLAKVEIDDVLVIYAAAPGQVAEDGDDGNSPFARSLAERLRQAGLALQLLGNMIRDDVVTATGGNQRPFVSSSMTGTLIYLVPVVVLPTARAEFVPPPVPAPIGGGVDATALIRECDRLAGEDVQADDALPELIIPACKRAVEAAPGNGRMMGQLGDGYTFAKDYVQARKWYEQAAAKGDAGAMTSLGILYADGHGVGEDDAQARKWYEQAAARGDAVAMTELGYLYERGRGGDYDLAQARRWYLQAAAKGNAVAMSQLGSLYWRGAGVDRDYAQARRWYLEAAAKGNAFAMGQLGSFYLLGWGVAADYVQARKWLEQAAAKGNFNAMARLGLIYLEGGGGLAQDQARGRKLLEQAAANGSDLARDLVNAYYMKGTNGFPKDPAKADRLVQQGILYRKEHPDLHPK